MLSSPGLQSWRLRYQTVLHVTCVAVVCVAAHAWSVGSYFCYDDWYFLSLARKWNLGQLPIFAPDCANSFCQGHHLRWYLLYRAFGDWAPGYHIVSIALHFLVALGVYFLARATAKHAGVSLAVALFFCVAAGHSEVIYWLSAVYPSVVALSALAALALSARYLKDNGSPWYLVACGAICGLALWTSERAVFCLMLVFFAPVVLGIKATRGKVRVLRWTMVLIGVAWAAAYILYARLMGPSYASSGYHTLMTLRGFGYNLWSSLPLFLMPDPRLPGIQHRLHDLAPALVLPLWLASKAATVTVIAILGGNLAFGSMRNRFWAVWCLAGICLGATCFAGFAGRYIYLPMIGFCMLLASHCAWLLTESRSRILRFCVPAFLVLLVSFNLAVDLVSSRYVLRNASERHAIVDSLRSYSARTGNRRVILSGLPDKYSVRLECGAELYGLSLLTDGKQSGSHPDYKRLSYLGNGRIVEDE